MLTVTATDADDPATPNGNIAYKLLNGTQSFSINSHTGTNTKLLKLLTFFIFSHHSQMPAALYII